MTHAPSRSSIPLLIVVLMLCALVGCHGEITPGAEVRWQSSPPTALTFTNTTGQRVRVDLAQLAVDHIELTPCDAPPAYTLNPFAPSIAFAHGEEAPTRTSEPFVESLLEPSGTLATLAPPATRYCEVAHLVTASDLLDGASLRIRGVYWPDPKGPEVPFEISTTLALDTLKILSLDLSQGQQTTLTIHRDLIAALSPLDLSAPSDTLAPSLLIALVSHATLEHSP